MIRLPMQAQMRYMRLEMMLTNTQIWSCFEVICSLGYGLVFAPLGYGKNPDFLKTFVTPVT